MKRLLFVLSIVVLLTGCKKGVDVSSTSSLVENAIKLAEAKCPVEESMLGTVPSLIRQSKEARHYVYMWCDSAVRSMSLNTEVKTEKEFIAKSDIIEKNQKAAYQKLETIYGEKINESLESLIGKAIPVDFDRRQYRDVQMRVKEVDLYKGNIIFEMDFTFERPINTLPRKIEYHGIDKNGQKIENVNGLVFDLFVYPEKKENHNIPGGHYKKTGKFYPGNVTDNVVAFYFPLMEY